jgi:hypothetical protein
MTLQKAQHSDIPRITALIGTERHVAPTNQPAAIGAQIKRDLDAGQFEWLVADTSDDIAVARIAVIPPPPIYDLKGGLAGIVLGTWRVTDIEPIDRHLRDRGAAVLVMDCAANDESKRSQLKARGYIATTHYMLKHGLAQHAPAPNIRSATEDDIPTLVAFNREGRDRLHEANPAFWTSHPDADARFALWMKLSLTMRDRAIFVSENAGHPTGFVIAQPPSPIQVPITLDDAKIGVIDDFHCTSFGASLRDPQDPAPARELLAAAETVLLERAKTAAIVICPAAWAAKFQLLEQAGYKTLHTWFARPA